MLRNDILEMPEKLKLRGMIEVSDEVMTKGRKARWASEKMIMELLKAEVAERHLRSIRYRMGHAMIPVIKDPWRAGHLAKTRACCQTTWATACASSPASWKR